MARRSFPPIRNSFSAGLSGLLTARCCHSLPVPVLVAFAELRNAPRQRLVADGLTHSSNGFYRVCLAGSVPVAAGGSALSSSDLGGLAADRAPAGREEAKPLLGCRALCCLR